MKVLNLRCDQAHGFEGWFASEDDFRSQLANGWLSCPLCGSHEVARMPSAPRLNLSGARECGSQSGRAEAGLSDQPHAQQSPQTSAQRSAQPAYARAASQAGRATAQADGAAQKRSAEAAELSAELPAALRADLQALWLKTVHQVMRHTEDVGERFPEEVRRMHYGEIAQRGIRGQATAEQRAELRDEGIEVVALPLPEALKGPLQ